MGVGGPLESEGKDLGGDNHEIERGHLSLGVGTKKKGATTYI